MANETQMLQRAANDFCEAMKRKLLSKKGQGWEGWDCVSRPEERMLMLRRLVDHALKGHEDPYQYIDVANFAMFLWWNALRRMKTLSGACRGGAHGDCIGNAGGGHRCQCECHPVDIKLPANGEGWHPGDPDWEEG